MNWYRSWPLPWPFDDDEARDHPHVVDNLTRLFMHGYDYRTVIEPHRIGWPQDNPGLCLLEWDVALDQRSRHHFAGQALAEPYRILVAPYQLGQAWLPRNLDDTPIEPGQTTAALFGFGCIYLPLSIVAEFLAMAMDWTDGPFTRWYHDTHGPARVTWDVHPQHLHEWPDA